MAESGNPVEKFAGIVIVIAMSVGIWVSSAPLHSARPVSKEVAGLEDQCDEARGIRARLWEDPLLALQAHEEELHASDAPPEHVHAIEDEPIECLLPEAELDDDWIARLLESAMPRLPHSAESFRAYFRNAIRRTGATRPEVHLLMCLLHGAPYVEDREMRLRARYAVLSALASNGFAPLDAQRLRVVEYAGRAYLVEVLVRRRALHSHGAAAEDGERAEFAVVVWVNDQYLAGETKPIRRLVELGEQIWRSSCEVRDRLTILGPTNSDDLEAFMRDQGSLCANPQRECRVYSPYATAQGSWQDPKDPGPSGRVLRTIGLDRELALALVEELHRRDICPAVEGNRVAILAEWDTRYGREWHQTMHEAIRIHARTHEDHRQGCISDEGLRDNLQAFSYMRGLDGRLPQDREAPPRQDKAQKNEGSTDPASRAEDRGRFDYILRLQRNLASFRGEIRACGVLGSDLYDKLILLQALRPSLRGVQFFTTDLDARMLEESEYPWTRNLLIASHFGLETDARIDEDLRRAGQSEPTKRHPPGMEVPPLRGSYQASVFWATQLAMGELTVSDLPLQPRLYEIGRSGAVRLDVREAGTFEFLVRNLPALVIALSLAVLLLTPFVRRLRFWDRRPRGRPVARFRRESWIRRQSSIRPVRRFTLLLAGLYVAALLILMALASTLPQEERWAWVDGTSAWPSEIIRLFAFLTCVAAMVHAYGALRKNAADLTIRIFPSAESKGEEAGPPDPPTRFCVARWDVAAGGRVSARRVWHEYLRLGRFRCSVGRVLLMSALYVGLSIACYNMSRPGAIPIRGSLSRLLDHVVLGSSVVGMVILIFFVIDATRLCNRFIRNIGHANVDWCGRDRHDAVVTRIELIAGRTAAVAPLIYAPFVVLLIMIAARHSIFDNWDWPPVLIGVFAVNLSAATVAAVTLRHRAESARKRAVEILQNSSSLSRTRLIQRIQAIKTGAYGAFHENPVLRAVLIPFGGLGTIGLVRLLS